MLSSFGYLFILLYLTVSSVIYSLSLHDALPICAGGHLPQRVAQQLCRGLDHRNHPVIGHARGDRKSTRLNSSHVASSYAVFCLKKKIQSNLTKFVVHGGIKFILEEISNYYNPAI